MKQHSVDVLMKRCSENKQLIYRGTLILRHGCSPKKFAVFFRRHFPKNASGGLLLSDPYQKNLYYGIFCAVLSKKYLRNFGLVRIKD